MVDKKAVLTREKVLDKKGVLAREKIKTICLTKCFLIAIKITVFY